MFYKVKKNTVWKKYIRNGSPRRRTLGGNGKGVQEWGERLDSKKNFAETLGAGSAATEIYWQPNSD